MPITLTLSAANGATSQITLPDTTVAAPVGYNNLTNWPSAANRPVKTGSVLNFIAPVGGGPSTAHDVAQSITLTNVTGGMSSTANGQIIQAKNITGGLYITHSNVHVIGCRVAGNGTYTIKVEDKINPPSGVVIEDCELDGVNITSTNAYIGGNGTIVRRCNNHSSVDGHLIVGSNQLYIDIWYHDAWRQAGAHIDPFTNDGEGDNVTVRHNWVGLSGTSDTTGCITFDPFWASINGCTVDNNYMAGGTYLLRFGSGNSLTNVICTNNYFDLSKGGNYYNCDGTGVVHLTTVSNNRDWNTQANIDSYISGR